MSTLKNKNQVLDEEAIRNFQEYLRIPSAHPNVDYNDCVNFLRKQADNLGLSIDVLTLVEKKPIVIITWLGKERALPAVMLNSHMDVVPAYDELWNHKPFSADIDSEGNIHARGSQDMKNVGVQYLEAIKRLKRSGVELKRSVHLTFVPDEEIGGEDGMAKFVQSEAFKNLNIGVALDEGAASTGEEFYVFYGEKSVWQFCVHCCGVTTHGSILADNTAGEKIQFIINKLLGFREDERKRLVDNPNLTISDITSINLTQLKGGQQSNVTPPQLTAVFDCRLPVTVDHDEWEKVLNQWCKEAGTDVWIEYELKQPLVPITKLDDSNPFWIAFKTAADDLGIKLRPIVCPGSTDAKYIRRIDIPALGFSPMNFTPTLLHAHNECLNVKTFLRGIEIYCKIIEKIGNV